MSDDDRVLDLLAEWECRIEQGEELSPEALCANAPELLSSVRRLLPRMARLNAALDCGTAQVHPPYSFGSPADPSPAGLDDQDVLYQEERFHAKGGLGEIYVVRDLRFNRRLALKRIKPDRSRDVRSRLRFLREAQITATLQHPGIPPVYRTVVDREARYGYSTRFIDGESLKAAIERLHSQPLTRSRQEAWRRELRALLGRFVVVCNTVAYAHEAGYLHRDLKPANIMLGRFGETLVIDWGLAKRYRRMEMPEDQDEQHIGPAPLDELDHTLDGEVLGTPAYMSPEQAAGNQQGLGPASDIFSLGAVLYAILTGTAPVRESAAPTPSDPWAAGPVKPPSKINPQVPRALEAVCLKALAPDPKARYATAQHLASDVERWLADEPTQAYRESRAERLSRWLRRHRSVAAAAGVLLVSAVLFLSILAATLAASGRQIAESKKVAEERLDLVLEVVEESYTKMARKPELLKAGMVSKRVDLLQAAADRYQELRIREGDRPDLVHRHGQALFRVWQARGSPDQDKRLAYEAKELLASLHRDYPAEASFMDSLAIACNSLAIREPNPAEAEELLGEAIRLDKELSKLPHPDPGVLDSLAGCYHNLALKRRKEGKMPEAIGHLKEAFAVSQQLAQTTPDNLEYQKYQASMAYALADFQHWAARNEDALQSQRVACELMEKAAGDHPDPEMRMAVAGYRAACAKSYSELQRLPEAIVSLTQARQALSECAVHLVRDNHSLSANRRVILLEYDALAYRAIERRQKAEIARISLDARTLAEELLTSLPNDGEVKLILAKSCFYGASLDRSADHRRDRLVLWERARELFAELLRQNEKAAHLQLHTAAVFQALANELGRVKEDRSASLAHFQSAFEHFALALKYATTPEQRGLVEVTRALCHVQHLRAQGHIGAAAQAAWALREIAPDDPDNLSDAAGELAACIPLIGEQIERERLGRQAVQLLEMCLNRGFSTLREWLSEPDFDPLREREDFKQLLKKLESKTPIRDKKG